MEKLLRQIFEGRALSQEVKVGFATGLLWVMGSPSPLCRRMDARTRDFARGAIG